MKKLILCLALLFTHSAQANSESARTHLIYGQQSVSCVVQVKLDKDNKLHSIQIGDETRRSKGRIFVKDPITVAGTVEKTFADGEYTYTLNQEDYQARKAADLGEKGFTVRMAELKVVTGQEVPYEVVVHTYQYRPNTRWENFMMVSRVPYSTTKKICRNIPQTVYGTIAGPSLGQE